MASSSACSTLQRTLTSDMYSQVLRSEARAQCLVRRGDGLSTTCLKSVQDTSGTGKCRVRTKTRQKKCGRGGEFTYSYVPRPFLPHEISKRAREEAEIMKLPHTQLQFAKQRELFRDEIIAKHMAVSTTMHLTMSRLKKEGGPGRSPLGSMAGFSRNFTT